MERITSRQVAGVGQSGRKRMALTSGALAVSTVALLSTGGQAFAVESPPAKAAAGRVGRIADVSSAQLTLPPPTSTIHWAVNRDGSVELSDKPKQGPVLRQGVQTYTGKTSAEAADHAQRQREYWRQQSLAFAERQRARDRELDAQRQAAQDRYEREQAARAPYFVVPWVRAHAYPVYPGGHGGWHGGGNLGNTPQAAALGGGPSPFLSSGFARTPGR